MIPPEKAHGSPYDRGRMDYYYGRQRYPHKYVKNAEGGYVEVTDLSIAEMIGYHSGFNDAKADGDQKQYSWPR